MNLEVLVGGYVGDWGELLVALLLESGFLEVDVLVELGSLLVVDVLELFEELGLLVGVVEGLEVFDQVVLLELADCGEDGWLDLHKICDRRSIKYQISHGV